MSGRDLGRGVPAFPAAPVRGAFRRLDDPGDVLALLDGALLDGDGDEPGAPAVVACVRDAGATFLAPLFDELAAVVCLAGTPASHLAIVSREYRVPCVMGARLDEIVADGTIVEVDCSGPVGIVRGP